MGCGSDHATTKFNSQPEISIISHTNGSIFEAEAAHVFRAQVSDANHAHELLEVQWMVDERIVCDWGTPGAQGEAVCELTFEEADSTVIANTRDPEGAAGQDQLTIQVEPVVVPPEGHPPVCSLLSPASGTAGLEGEVVYFMGYAVDEEDGTASLIASWLSDKDGALGESVVNSDGSIAFSTQSLSVDSHTISLQVIDLDGESCTSSIFYAVNAEPLNYPPELGELMITPATIYTNDIITAQVTATDPDGDAVTVSYEWLVDGVQVPELGSQLDGSLYFDKGQVVSLTVTASDLYGVGAEEYRELTVLNSPPLEPVVVVTPTGAMEQVDELLCEVSSPSLDVDNDPLGYTISWSVDGVLWTGQVLTTVWAGDTISALDTHAGEVWVCSVTPYDDEEEGAAATASTTISAPPVSVCPDGNCALRFDGIDDYVEIPHSSTLNASSTGLTVEAWIYYDALSGPLQPCMTAVRKGISSSSTYEYWLHKNLSPSDSLFWTSSGGWSVTSFSAVYSGGWLHYAGVSDFSTSTSYTFINGVLLDTGSAFLPPANTEVVRIGIDWDFGCAMYGVIDEVRISSVPRYTIGFTPATVFTADAATMALYHFDSFTGTTAYDSSANGNNGTIWGATWTSESP